MCLGCSPDLSDRLGRPGVVNAQDNPLARHLDVLGAKTTLPVNSAKSPFSLAFAQDVQQRFENFHSQLGGDHAPYYNLHLGEVLQTAVSKPHELYRPLDKALDPDVGDKVSFTTKEGDLTLNEYVVHPIHRVQAVVMVHEGKIVYETYPGMNPMDQHVWTSQGKTTVALVIAQMEAEGKIDTNKEVVDHIPEFKGTNCNGIKMIDAANMATALQLEETLEASVDPKSIIVRFFGAEFGTLNPATGKVEDWLSILKEAEKIEGEASGYRFRYSSAVAPIFVEIARAHREQDLGQDLRGARLGQHDRPPVDATPSDPGRHVRGAWAALDDSRGFCPLRHAVHAELGQGRGEVGGLG